MGWLSQRTISDTKWFRLPLFSVIIIKRFYLFHERASAIYLEMPLNMLTFSTLMTNCCWPASSEIHGGELYDVCNASYPGDINIVDSGVWAGSFGDTLELARNCDLLRASLKKFLKVDLSSLDPYSVLFPYKAWEQFFSGRLFFWSSSHYRQRMRKYQLLKWFVFECGRWRGMDGGVARRLIKTDFLSPTDLTLAQKTY